MKIKFIERAEKPTSVGLIYRAYPGETNEQAVRYATKWWETSRVVAVGDISSPAKHLLGKSK